LSINPIALLHTIPTLTPSLTPTPTVHRPSSVVNHLIAIPSAMR
jgi:hypothetical protein